MSLMFVLLLAVSGSGGPEPVIKRIYGPETQTGQYKHPAAIAELANGDLYVAYYGGTGEYAVDTGVFGGRLRKGSRKWSTPVRIAHDPFRSVGNPVVWQAPDGLVWLFYVVRWGETWSTSRIQAKISRDYAHTWSDSFVVSETEGMMVRGKPIVLASGDYLLPVYHETGHDTERVGPDTTSRFLRYNTAQRIWEELGVIRSPKGNLQPAIAELGPNHLIAFCRRGGDYEPVTDGYIVWSESRDGGRTWAPGVDSAFPNPNAAVDLLKLKSGSLLLIYNHSMNERTPLSAVLSRDGGKTWSRRRDIATGPYDYAYPFAVQSADGSIHLIFTSHERTVVQHAVFREEWFTD